MSRLVLIFPNTITIRQFLLEKKASKAIVNTSHLTLSAFYTDEQILDECKKYGAKLKTSGTVKPPYIKAMFLYLVRNLANQLLLNENQRKSSN